MIFIRSITHGHSLFVPLHFPCVLSVRTSNTSSLKLAIEIILCAQMLPALLPRHPALSNPRNSSETYRNTPPITLSKSFVRSAPFRTYNVYPCTALSSYLWHQLDVCTTSI